MKGVLYGLLYLHGITWRIMKKKFLTDQFRKCKVNTVVVFPVNIKRF